MHPELLYRFLQQREQEIVTRAQFGDPAAMEVIDYYRLHQQSPQDPNVLALLSLSFGAFQFKYPEMEEAIGG